MNNTRIVFMGTPDFAVPNLKALIDNQYNVVGVFSQPDRPKGRGYKLVPTPVKALALEHNIPVFQPESLKDESALETLKELDPQIIVVVAYGKILPKVILDLPELGCINVHGSLLPALRGAAPIQWSVINGDKTTGVTTMYMDVGMDTGDMILTKETAILPDETAGELFDRLAPIGAELLVETLPLVIAGNAPRQKQDESLATHAPMITKDISVINFGKTAQQIHDLVRGTHPWPKSHSFLDDNRIIINKTKVIDNSIINENSGEIIDPKQLIVACGVGSIQLLEVQQQGKKAVSGTDFANGNRLSVGKKFNSLT